MKNIKQFKILIVDVDGNCGGPLVLAKLCDVLREAGYNASIFMSSLPLLVYDNTTNLRFLWGQLKLFVKFLLYKCSPNIGKKYSELLPNLDSMKHLKFKFIPFYNRDKTIVIYPETYYGNPLNAKYIVRWLLYHYRLKNEPNAYNRTDLFVAYREIFNDSDLNPNKHIVTICDFNSKLYRQYNFGERNGNCYIIRKGKLRNDLPDKFDGPVFDDNMSMVELVRIFNESKYCYSYDTQTFYCSIAAVCGCIPIVLLEDGKTISDYLSADEKHYGVAYGNTPEQIEYAIQTRPLLLQSLDYSKTNLYNAHNLISILEDRFGKIKEFGE